MGGTEGTAPGFNRLPAGSRFGPTQIPDLDQSRFLLWTNIAPGDRDTGQISSNAIGAAPSPHDDGIREGGFSQDSIQEN